MKLQSVLDETQISALQDHTVIGIDIGSRQSKAVLIHGDELYTALIPTGFFMQESADELTQNLTAQAGIHRGDVDYIVATGYGRIALKFTDIPYKLVTEISCHGMGAHYLDHRVKTIIDIGGQDSKAISIDPENGQVKEFAMNDKCAAGTGRFLEKIAEVLGYNVTEIGKVATTSTNPSSVSSQCVVFAESEVVSERAKGSQVNDLAAGINLSVAKRVRALLGKVGIEKEVLFTGGVSNNIGMRKAFEQLLGFPLLTPKLDTVFAGALGAAVYASGYARENETPAAAAGQGFRLDLSPLKKAVEKNTQDYIHHTAGKSHYVAYLCSYIPLELFSAADVAFTRLMNAGDQQELSAGEGYTQSVFCDITKSILGGFATGKPLYKAVERVYIFDACDCMRKSAEAIHDQFVPVASYHLPRKRKEEASRRYLVQEMEAIKEDLEALTGRKIPEAEIRKQIALYNKARRCLKEISEYRNYPSPLFNATEFKEITSAYFSLPIEELLRQYEGILTQLRSAVPGQEKKVRLLLSGGITAIGDDKITHITEQELGASIVAEDNCTGLKPIYCQLPETGNVFEDLAFGYIDQPPCLQMRPVEDALDFTLQLAKDYQVDGVVYYYLKFCQRYSIMAYDYIQKFQQAGIPILVLPGDYSNGDEGQIRTRLEAFVEVLQERKETR